MPITVSKTHRCFATRSGNVFRLDLNFNSGLNTRGTRSRRCEFQFRQTIYRLLREEPPFEDVRVSDNLIAVLDCRLRHRDAQGPRDCINLHRTAAPLCARVLERFLDRTSSLRRSTKTRVSRFRDEAATSRRLQERKKESHP